MPPSKIEKDIIDGGKTIPYDIIKKHPEAEREFIQRNKRGHQFPTIQKYACGEYAVRSILSMYGKDYMDVDIADEDGVEIEEIQKRLEEDDILTEILEHALYEDILPKSLLYYPTEDHWVAVESVNKENITIHDSNFSDTRTYKRDGFERKWLDDGTGYVVNTYSPEESIYNKIYKNRANYA